MAQSFSGMVKEELLHQPDQARHCNLAETAAMLCLGGRLLTREAGPCLELRTENNSTARKYFTLLKKTFNISSTMSAAQLPNRKKNRMYTLTVDDPDEIALLLEGLRLRPEGDGGTQMLRFSDQLMIQRDCCRRAFLRGAFLASGSVSDPARTYHFEIVCADDACAKLLGDVIRHFEAQPRTVRRKQHEVVYIKDSAQIMDLLGLMGATGSMMQIQNVQILKSIRNRANRGVNCDTANIRRVLEASARQIEDIRYLQETGRFEELPEQIREVARLRVTYPEATLADLGEMLPGQVGKSGVNHRLKKISQIAEKLRGEKKL